MTRKNTPCCTIVTGIVHQLLMLTLSITMNLIMLRRTRLLLQPLRLPKDLPALLVLVIYLFRGLAILRVEESAWKETPIAPMTTMYLVQLYPKSSTLRHILLSPTTTPLMANVLPTTTTTEREAIYRENLL